MRGTFGILVTLLLLLLPTYSSHAQSIRAGGFANRGISGARIGTIGSGRHGMVSNFRGRFSQVGSASSFRGNRVVIGNGMVSSSLQQSGFRRNISSAGASFSPSSNLTESTLGKSYSNPQFKLISNSTDNTITPVNRGSMRFGSRPINRARFRIPATDTSFSKTNVNSVSSNNAGNTFRGPNNPLIIDKRAPSTSRRLYSNRNGNLKTRVRGKDGNLKLVNGMSIASSPSKGIVHWVDRNNGMRHYTNDRNSIPEEAKTITLVDGKEASLQSGLSGRYRNVRNSRSRFRESSLASSDRTPNLVLEKNVDFPGHRPGFSGEQNHLTRNVQNTGLNNGSHGSRGFNQYDHDHFHHHHFHNAHFFVISPFLFNNSFFFISPVFPRSNFFFNPFVFQPPAIFPSRFFGFQPFFVPSAPVVFIPVFPQLTTFTPFIDPFLLNPFFSPFLFGTDFYSTSIAINNFF